MCILKRVSIPRTQRQVFHSLTPLLNKKERLQVRIKLILWFSSYQTVGVDLLGLDFLVCRDLLDVLLSFLQPVKNRPAGT